MHITKRMKSLINELIDDKNLYLINIKFQELELTDISQMYEIVNKAYYYIRSNTKSVFYKNTKGSIKKYFINEINDGVFEAGIKLLVIAYPEYVPEKIKNYFFMSLIKQLGISSNTDLMFSVELKKINTIEFNEILNQNSINVKNEHISEIKNILWRKKVITFSGDFIRLKLKYARKKRNPSREG